MVRGMNAVSLRVLGKEWTKVSCHADSALAPRCSNPDHHLASASLASLTTRENNHGPWKRLPVMDSRRSAAGNPPARAFLALRNIRFGCWHRMGPRRGQMLTRHIREMSLALETVCQKLDLRLTDPNTRLVTSKIIELAQRGMRDAATLSTMTLKEFKHF
jgi:hypothetical protein